MRSERWRSLLKAVFRRGAAPSAPDRFRDDPASPWLVSFPRTGSHWLRMMLELYTDQPLLPRSFLHHAGCDYLLNHSHDYEFALWPNRLIYLYRDPAATVFSQIKFHNQDVNDLRQIELWSTLYRLHLRHWLNTPRPNRTVVRYEHLRADIVDGLSGVLVALGQVPNPEHIRQVAQSISRKEVTTRTQHDERVMNREVDYEQQRSEFLARHGPAIHRMVIDEGQLSDWFSPMEPHLDAA
jgi:hypothetical protein